MPIGMNKSNAGLGGYAPQQNLTGYPRMEEKRLFHSRREIALLLDKTVRGGFGELEMGTIMSIDQNSGNLVPYIPDTISTEDVGRAFLLNNIASAGTSFDLLLSDSYKFESGDVIILTSTAGTYEEATISDVDRVSYPHKAVVTLSAGTSAGFTVAEQANAYLKSEDAASGKRSVAAYLMDQTIYTGIENPDPGALTSVVLSNAVVYKSGCVGMDAAAMSNLGNVIEDGIFYVIK
jgi:hypothetical protein